MNDERFLKDWLQDTTDSSSDPNASADKVVARLPEAPQRRRWLPWPPARRSDPDPQGRTRFMLSPAKAISLVAIVAIGASFAITQPLTTDPAPAPPAADSPDTPVFPVAFSGSWMFGPQVGNDLVETTGTGIKTRGDRYWTPQVVEDMSDERLRGDVYAWGNDDWYGSGPRVWHGGFSIVNDQGEWHTVPTVVFDDPEGVRSGATYTFIGEGGYDGLVAIADFALDDQLWTINGYVIDGALPPAGDPPDLSD